MTTQNTTKMFDYTAFTDPLRTVSWSYFIHQMVWLIGLKAQPSNSR